MSSAVTPKTQMKYGLYFLSSSTISCANTVLFFAVRLGKSGLKVSKIILGELSFIVDRNKG